MGIIRTATVSPRIFGLNNRQVSQGWAVILRSYQVCIPLRTLLVTMSSMRRIPLWSSCISPFCLISPFRFLHIGGWNRSTVSEGNRHRLDHRLDNTQSLYKCTKHRFWCQSLIIRNAISEKLSNCVNQIQSRMHLDTTIWLFRYAPCRFYTVHSCQNAREAMKIKGFLRLMVL